MDDSVLDDEQFPIFSGTVEETKEWLQRASLEDTCSCVVRLGDSMEHMSVSDYLLRKD